jgi:hypothetical protein
MPTPSTTAGGAPIALSVIAGTAIGFFAGETTLGFFVGLGIGVAIAVAIWRRGR